MRVGGSTLFVKVQTRDTEPRKKSDRLCDVSSPMDMKLVSNHQMKTRTLDVLELDPSVLRLGRRVQVSLKDDDHIAVGPLTNLQHLFSLIGETTVFDRCRVILESLPLKDSMDLTIDHETKIASLNLLDSQLDRLVKELPQSENFVLTNVDDQLHVFVVKTHHK